MTILYLTDTEGRWDKLVDVCAEQVGLSLQGDQLCLDPDVSLVYGGDTVDRGPHGLRLLRALVEAHDRYPGRVVLLAGNRDINKLRLARELSGHPPPNAPNAPLPEVLRWIFARTMGAADAFAHRQAELGGSEDDVVESYRADLTPDGWMWRYLERARLGYQAGETLFVHGAVTDENLFQTPDRPPAADLNGWLVALNDFYRRHLDAFRAHPEGTSHHPIIAYQAPLPGTRSNQTSVVYGRLTANNGNPHLPSPAVRQALRAHGIRRLVVGHTPTGDTPSVLREQGCEDGFELILADNAYGHLERGATVVLQGPRTRVCGWVQPRGEAICKVDFTLDLDTPSHIGAHLPTGQLIKGGLADGRRLLFRFLPGWEAEEIAG